MGWKYENNRKSDKHRLLRDKAVFFNRAEKFNADNPYSVTMYQDNNKELVIERNRKELEKLLPLLKLNDESKVLDIACGIGRWADALPNSIKEYCGIDFSEGLISIANERNEKEQFCFLEGSIINVEQVLGRNGKGKYNIILMIGILMYLNDDDMSFSLEQVERICEEEATICIREPIGIRERLTLKDFFSEELKDSYNAIYRTREELFGFFEKTFFNHGFQIVEEGFLFDGESLNNRKETSQYYFVLHR